jgi:hypothetical protein
MVVSTRNKTASFTSDTLTCFTYRNGAWASSAHAYRLCDVSGASAGALTSDSAFFSRAPRREAWKKCAVGEWTSSSRSCLTQTSSWSRYTRSSLSVRYLLFADDDDDFFFFLFVNDTLRYPEILIIMILPDITPNQKTVLENMKSCSSIWDDSTFVQTKSVTVRTRTGGMFVSSNLI